MKEQNIQQARASAPGEGVSLVIAGAGTGKTSTMIVKIGNVLAEGACTPSSILILTFSRHAAEEIKSRLAGKTDKKLSGTFAGTFHSFCLSLLKEFSREYIELKGFSSFPRIMEEEGEEVMKDIIMKAPEKFMGMPCRAVLRLADRNSKIRPEFRKKLEASGLIHEIERVRTEYREYKIKKGLIDFSDLMDHCIELIESHSAIREKLHDRYSYIFVDEFQDTSEKNFRLLSLILPEKNRNLFMVGDDYQSIYAFRDARVDYIINIKQFFREAEIYKLTVNYRSRKEIVDISNRFIHLNRFRTSKKIVSASGRGGTVQFCKAADRDMETEWVIKILGRSQGSAAVLARNNYQVMHIKKSLSGLHPQASAMTMHASKGLEFDNVIISGVCDRIIPDRTTDIEEERRLFYVALTRAREKLFIIYTCDSKGRLPRFVRELGYRK